MQDLLLDRLSEQVFSLFNLKKKQISTLQSNHNFFFLQSKKIIQNLRGHSVKFSKGKKHLKIPFLYSFLGFPNTFSSRCKSPLGLLQIPGTQEGVVPSGRRKKEGFAPLMCFFRETICACARQNLAGFRQEQKERSLGCIIWCSCTVPTAVG